MLWTQPALAIVIGYLLGSIPFGLILTRMGGAGDVRAIGSGSIGATNVLRTGRKGLAVATLLLDAGKGAAAVFVANAIDPGFGPIGALAAFVGHCYPVWLKFRGGKGVATALGILLALSPPLALTSVAAFILVVFAVRIVSVASLAAALVAPAGAVALGETALLPLMIALALLIVWKHRSNLGRLRAGTEPRLGKKS